MIAAGYTHLLALHENGTVTGLGTDSGWGETSPPAGLDNVLQISGGLEFSLALKNDGSVVAWGRDDAGQTAVPAGLGDTKMVAAGALHALALAYNSLLMYPVDISQDLLLIYNVNSVNSTTVMHHYLEHRPMVGDANVLGVDCPAAEIYTSRPAFTNDIMNPILGWLADHPTKRP